MEEEPTQPDNGPACNLLQSEDDPLGRIWALMCCLLDLQTDLVVEMTPRAARCERGGLQPTYFLHETMAVCGSGT